MEMYMFLLKIATWYGRLRDTFAGKILTTFQKYFPLTRNLKIFYPNGDAIKFNLSYVIAWSPVAHAIVQSAKQIIN